MPSHSDFDLSQELPSYRVLLSFLKELSRNAGVREDMSTFNRLPAKKKARFPLINAVARAWRCVIRSPRGTVDKQETKEAFANLAQLLGPGDSSAEELVARFLAMLNALRNSLMAAVQESGKPGSAGSGSTGSTGPIASWATVSTIYSDMSTSSGKSSGSPKNVTFRPRLESVTKI